MGRYSKTKVLTSFTAVLPADQPRYALLIMLDEPQPTPESHGYATSGWNAVPVGGAVIARIAPLAGDRAAVRACAGRQADPAASATLGAIAASRNCSFRILRPRNLAIRRYGFVPASVSPGTPRSHEARQPAHRRCRRRCALRRARGDRHQRRQPHDQAGRRVRGDRRQPRTTGCASSVPAIAAGAAAIIAERVPAAPLPEGVAFVQVADARRALALGAAKVLSAPARCDRGRHRHERQDLGRRLHAPDLGRARQAGREHRHHRARLAEARSLRLAHHARSGGAASLARRTRRRRRDASGDGSILARPRSAPARRRAGRRRRLHQSQPRSSRLSPDARILSCRQAAAVHRPDRAGRRGRDRRRP